MAATFVVGLVCRSIGLDWIGLTQALVWNELLTSFAFLSPLDDEEEEEDDEDVDVLEVEDEDED
jgi:hypothetical protein